MPDTLKCYEILEVEPGAAAPRVRNSYIELCRVWDPERYIDNPTLRERAEKKRKEIEEAYQALRVFLPELQGPQGEQQKTVRLARDFKELATETSIESSRAILGIIVGIFFIFIFAWAFFLMMKGRGATPVSVPLE